ncbi:hypothetical protein CTI14_72325, partial [Methylobacterium radiotolerans]
MYRDHEGTRYYFCCAGCGPAFDADPAKYATAEAAGLYRDHEGTRYYFCCAGCGPAFDADPA